MGEVSLVRKKRKVVTTTVVKPLQLENIPQPAPIRSVPPASNPADAPKVIRVSPTTGAFEVLTAASKGHDTSTFGTVSVPVSHSRAPTEKAVSNVEILDVDEMSSPVSEMVFSDSPVRVDSDKVPSPAHEKVLSDPLVRAETGKVSSPNREKVLSGPLIRTETESSSQADPVRVSIPRETFPVLEDVFPAPPRRSAPSDKLADQPYVPGWNVSVRDKLSTFRVAREIVDHAAPPLTAIEVQNFSDRQVQKDLTQCLSYTLALSSESLFRWSDQERMASAYQAQLDILKERLDQRDKELDVGEDMLRALARENTTLKSALREATSRPVVGEGQMIVEASTLVNLEKQVESLKSNNLELQNSIALKEAEVAREKALAMERAGEVDALKKQVEKVSSDNRWLVEHGLKNFVSKLHGSSEFLVNRTRLCEAARAAGYSEGVKEAYRAARTKTPMSEVRSFDPQALEKYDALIDAGISEDYPFLEKLSSHAGQSIEKLQEIRPSSPTMDS